MCGHSGGVKLWEGFEISKLSWEWGGRNLEAVLGRGFETVPQGFCSVLNIYLTISFTSFFGLGSFSNKSSVLFQLVGN